MRVIHDHSKIVDGHRRRLILTELDAYKEFYPYELCYRWYRGNGVLGSECSYYLKSDIQPILEALEKEGTLFDHFQLF